MAKTVIISIAMVGCACFLFARETPYLNEFSAQTKQQHQSVETVKKNFDFLISKLDRPYRISWVGTLTPSGQFTNDNVDNLKQFTVVLQTAIAPSVLKLDNDAEIFLFFIPDKATANLARQMFGDSIEINKNGYAFAIKPNGVQ